MNTPMLTTSLMLLASLIAQTPTVASENTLPMRSTHSWTVDIGPGTVETPDGAITLEEAQSFDVARPATVQVRAEAHANLPLFNPKTAGWVKGIRLKSLITAETNATYALIPHTMKLYDASDKMTLLILGKDYDLDPVWGTFGRIEGGAIHESDTVYADYDYRPDRVDSIVHTPEGLRYLRGKQGVGVILPPPLPEGATVLANIWLPGAAQALTDENLLPVDFAYKPAAPQNPAAAERFLPKTLAKLRAGETVTIVAFGDSVTNGGGVERQPEAKYQNVFVRRLQARFPDATIVLKNAAWGGARSIMYLNAPRGGNYDYIRDVLEPKPDLVTMEFVNDAYMNAATMASQYGRVAKDVEKIGGELILIAPHFVRKDWMPTDTIKTLDDPRHYVQDLRAWTTQNDIALADAADLWCNLWRTGIPYPTLLENSINHPDARGHKLFADALMALFPEASPNNP